MNLSKMNTGLLTHSKTVAVMPERGLGDSVVIMIIAANLQQAGYDVTYFSDYAYQLRNWFPSIIVKPYPSFEEHEKVFAEFDKIFIDIGRRDICFDAKHHQNLKYFFFNAAKEFADESLSMELMHKTFLIGAISNAITLVEKTVVFCRDVLGLAEASSANGMVPLAGLQYRKYPKRIVIHPTGTKISRCWPPKKFVKLARILQKREWQPVFSVSPAERQAWKAIIKDEFLLPEFPSVSDLASFLYESGYFIGNDSGPGHLASCLGTPTLTIWRKFKERRWQPGWNGGILVLPLKVPILAKSRRYWRYMLSVRRVFNAFKRLSNLKI